MFLNIKLYDIILQPKKATNVMKDIVPLQFIKNTICGDDLFEGKSHQDTAKAIKNIITREDDSCNVIGIDGGWGSGKSNLVKLIENEIYSKDNPERLKYRFFTYDAWGHQEDLQRRSILEEMIDDLIVVKKITKGSKISLPPILGNKWRNKLKLLLSKSREVGTITTPKFSCGIILSALAIVLTPILNSITANMCSFHQVVYKSIPIGIFLLYLLGLFSYNLYKLGIKRIGLVLKSTLNTAFNIYTGKQKENTTFETISEDEPSSRNFKTWMNDIDTDLKDNKLILVFDNMDRLPKNKVQELWATIHTFFADVNYKNIKVIVPFDRSHIISAFKNEDTEIVTKWNNEGESSAVKTGTKICYGDDYINKTFDVIFRVAPPTMSNWRNYFNSLWQQVFGEGEKADSRTLQIFDVYTPLLTPRKIIAFINEVASIKQMGYAKDIDCEYIALFIFGKMEIYADPNVELLKPSYLSKSIEYLYKNDPDLPKYTSALYYQLTPDKAMDVVNTDKLKKALDAGDSKFIEDVKDSPAFNHILDIAISMVTNIPNVVAVLDEKEKCTSSNWDHIYKRLNSVKGEALTHTILNEYQIKLLLKLFGQEQQDYLRSIITDFYKDNTVEDAVVFIESIIKLSISLGNDEPYKYLKSIKVGAALFINFIKSAKDDWKRYRISCDQILLDKHFDLFTFENVKDFDIYKYIKDDFTFDTYKMKLNSLIKEHITVPENLYILYSGLKEINTPIVCFLSEDELYELKNSTTTDSPFYYDLICMRISLFPTIYFSRAACFESEMNNTESLFVEEIAKRIECYMSYGDLLINLPSFNEPLYKAVVKMVTENKYTKSKIDIKILLPKYDSIMTELEVPPSVLLNRLDNLVTSEMEEINTSIINTTPLEFFKNIKSEKIDNNLIKHCIKVAQNYLNELPKEKWLDAIKNSNNDFNLLEVLNPKLPQNCFDALDILLNKYARDNTTAINEQNAQLVINMAEKDTRGLTPLFIKIRHSLVSTARITPDLFKFYGDWLFKYGKMSEDNESLGAIFPPSSIVDNDKCLTIILNHKEKMIKIVEVADSEGAKEFKAKIQDMLDKETYNHYIEFENFANSIGIHKSNITEGDLETKNK